MPNAANPVGTELAKLADRTGSGVAAEGLTVSEEPQLPGVVPIRDRMRRRMIEPFSKGWPALTASSRTWLAVTLTSVSLIESRAAEFVTTISSIQTPEDFGFHFRFVPPASLRIAKRTRIGR